MLTVFFDHGIINRKKNCLMCQSVGNSLEITWLWAKRTKRKISRVKMEITNRNRFLAVGLEAAAK